MDKQQRKIRDYLQELYSDRDGYFCIFLLPRGADKNNKKFITHPALPGETKTWRGYDVAPRQLFYRPEAVESIITSRAINILNRKVKYDVYYSLSQFREPRRRAESASSCRAIYADFDHSSPALDAFLQGKNYKKIQCPSYLINTSPGKYQAIWILDNSSIFNKQYPPEMHKSILSRFANLLQSDPATVDAPRIYRLPGYLNCKYDPPFEATIQKTGGRYRNLQAFLTDLDGSVPETTKTAKIQSQSDITATKITPLSRLSEIIDKKIEENERRNYTAPPLPQKNQDSIFWTPKIQFPAPEKNDEIQR